MFEFDKFTGGSWQVLEAIVAATAKDNISIIGTASVQPYPLSLFELLFCCLSSFLPLILQEVTDDTATSAEKFGMAD